MHRIIRPVSDQDLNRSLSFIETVFTDWSGPEEGTLVRHLVAEIRSKPFYIPELDLVATDEKDEIIGFALFSRFRLEGRYEHELLLLSPVGVKTELQRRHISRDLLEYGFQKAAGMGYRAVLVEGNPRNYSSRGFQPAYLYGILPGPSVHLPHPECLMAKELVPDGLNGIHGLVDYSCYEALH